MTGVWTPSVLWDTAHVTGEDLIIHLDAGDPLLHIAIIDRDVLNDAFATSGSDLVGEAIAHRDAVEAAIARAWSPDRLREALEIGGEHRNMQLRLMREDFR